MPRDTQPTPTAPSTEPIEALLVEIDDNNEPSSPPAASIDRETRPSSS